MSILQPPTSRAFLVALLWLPLGGCADGAHTPSNPSTPSAATTSATSTPAPATATPTALPTPTSTPTATCSLAITDARFEPDSVLCPAGTTSQTARVVFEITAGNHVDIGVNRVSSANVTCRFSRGSCTWGEASLSFSPSSVAAGHRTEIAASQRFTCTSSGTGSGLGELVFGALYVNTSCGAAQELKVTNVLTIR